MDGFVHLHVHSHYSLLDGGNRIEDLVTTAAALGMESLALTDHGNLFGAMEFALAAREAGIKPILGMEAYISPTTRHDRSMGNIQTAAYHLLLLAATEAGWRNLMKLSSRAYLEGFYYRPRVDRELLARVQRGADLHHRLPGRGGALGACWPVRRTGPGRSPASTGTSSARTASSSRSRTKGLAEQDQVNPLLVELAGQLGVGAGGHQRRALPPPGGQARPRGPDLHLHGQDARRGRRAELLAGALSQKPRRDAAGAGRPGRGRPTTRSRSPRCARPSWTSAASTCRSSTRPTARAPRSTSRRSPSRRCTASSTARPPRSTSAGCSGSWRSSRARATAPTC